MNKTAEPIHSQTRLQAPYPMPLVRVDVACLSVADGLLKALLAKRAQEPYKQCWGLPGGVLRIDLDESLESTARRVAHERMKLELGRLDQVVSVGGANRDPRAPWAMTVVYRCFVGEDITPETGKRVDAFQWLTLDEISQASSKGLMAFDHDDLISQAVAGLRSDVQAMRFSNSWFIEPFTVPELQSFCESVLGEPLDKVTFRRRLDVHQVLVPLSGQMRTGPFRPAQLYVLSK